MPVTESDVDKLFAFARDRYLLLLLAEASESVPKVKPGIPALAYKVQDVLTDSGGPLDEALTNWAEQRPSHVVYRRLLMDRDDSKVMTKMGVCWLPQVRLVRRETLLFRSSVSVGDNGEFLTQDVGGRSFRRRVPAGPSGFVNLLDALSAETDRAVR